MKLQWLLLVHLLLTLSTRADLPPGWSSTDIGGPAITGSADHVNGNWTVSGGGSDIWNNADQFQYVYTTVEGDCMMTARVNSLQNTDPGSGWSKAGLMFRNDSTPGSANVTIVATWSQGISFQWRSSAGGNSQNFGVPGINAPVWLRLARNGSTFTGYYSLNGSDWVQVTSQTVALNNALLAGLDVTAHNNSALHTATFTNVSVLGSATNLPPQITGQPADALVAVGQNATFNVQLLVTAGATYQWYRGATNLPGATNASFSLSPVTPGDNGAQFYCAITNAHGSTNTRVATLTISTNGILRDVWLNIGGGSAVADLTNHAAFPDNPSFDAVLTDLFETPSNAYDQYGQRLRALITAPETGDYRFWIASDDGGQLFVSTDETPANRQLVASVSVWASPRQWNKYPEQQSAAIPLVAGQRYYIEALMKEGGGGDNLAAQWQLPSGGFESPIPASRCVPFGVGPPVISRQPTNLTVIEGAGAGFSVALARTFGATFQWKRNGANLPGATNSIYSLSSVALSDNASTFSCAITNSYGWTNSAVATLTVLADTNRPTILSAVNLGDNTRVTVLYSEPVEAASATNASNYALNLSATVSAARFAGDNRTVILTTSPLNVGPTYTLTVNNVRDRATTPNTILPNSTAQFTLAVSPLDIRYVVGTNEPIGPSSRRTGLVVTEIMYHPTNRTDGRNLEFIELYNSNPWAEDLSGYRLSGDADYSFPAGTTIPARSYRIVAANPTDMAAVHGLAGVLGPLTNSTSGNTTNVLDNGGGTLRLRDELDSVLLEVEYDDESPWPVSPDGAGPSLVLARPSYGEADPRAWSASDRVGGSPGASDVPTSNPWRTVVINEVLAHTDPPLEDYVELFNYSTNDVNLGNCILTDDPATNRFVITAGTTIPRLGRLAFTQTQLGFALDAAGETIYLKAADGSRVVDALRFDAQENSVAYGRYPDGATTFRRLSQPTLGNANARPLLSDVVINELQYHPVTENDDEEFVEIYNRGTNAVNLGGWRLRGGISFTFATGTSLPAGGYAVVARSLTNFFQSHPAVNPALVLGEFSGGLGNGGDVVRLTKPDDLVSTNQLGQLVTNKIHIAVDEVSYGTGGRWGSWADGGGSSLERMDPRGFGNFAPNWADSDETAKSGWTTVEFTGLLDNGGMANADQLQILLLGAGECLVDDVEVIPQGGGNIVVNGSFDNSNGWFMQGTHQDSAWQATGGYSGGCLRVVASDRGDTGANRIRTVLTQTLSPGTTATLRARVRWLKGHPELLLRLHGNYLEAAGPTLTTRAFGSPGTINSRYVTNAGPAIASVSHWPVLPAAGEPVTITAQIDDADGLSAALLKYRLDPDTNFISVALSYRGAGLYSATIPGQAAGAQVAFYLETYDGGAGLATTRFPANAPVRECLVRFGEPAGLPMLGSYRLWVSERNVTQWNTREKQSNHPLDATFVYGDVRVCYNAGTLYSGSPWHTPGYSGPMGSACDYELNLAKDDLVLGDDDFVLGTIGNLNSEGSLQAEQASFWILRKLGAPYLYRRHVRVFFNGQQRGNVYEDAQQPNREVVSQFFPNDDAGSFHKIEDWFEFDDSGDNKTGNTDATLENFTTTGGAKKTARYRWTWRPRGVRESANDFTNLFTLVNAANAPQPEPYRSQVAALVEVEEWMRILAGERIVGNWDSYGYSRGKNMYAYKPDNAPWQLLAWDIDFAFGTGGGDGPNSGLFGGNEPVINQLRAFPEFQRAYWRAFQDAVNGPLDATTFASHVDPIYNGLVTAGAGPDAGTTQALKDYAAARRSYILGQLSGVAANFTVNGSTSFSTNRNFITITGTAPIGVATLTINGVAAQPTWTSVTGWTLRIALQPGLNNLTIAGWNNKGQAVAGASVSLAVTFTGVIEPADRIVINELMYNPAAPETEFMEIVNTATNTAYDLSNWRLNGLDGTVLAGTILQPGAFLVFAKNAEEFWRVYGSAIPLAGTFSGTFDKGGETIQLVQPGTTSAQDVIIDQVTYDDDLPWPTGADGTGPSLQLVDPTRDNNRVVNWLAVSPPAVPPAPQVLVTWSNSWRYNQTANLNGQNWTAAGYNDAPWPSGPGVLAAEDCNCLPEPIRTPLTTANGRTTFYFRTSFNYTGSLVGVSLKLSALVDDGAVFYLNGQRLFALRLTNDPPVYTDLAANLNNATFEGPFTVAATALQSGTNVLAVEVHQSATNSSDVAFAMRLETDFPSGTNVAIYTPGTTNSVRASLAAFPTLWLNELLTVNNATVSNAVADRFGEYEPWVELYNGGTNPISLANFYLTTNYNQPTLWPFAGGATIQPGEFKLVWLDGEPGESNATEWHTSFRLTSGQGSLALTYVASGRTNVLDYLNYNVPSLGRSYGNYPDANVSGRRLFSVITPGATNNPASLPVQVYINEWMADNLTTRADPADGQFEDWFEIYNPGMTAVDLGGNYFTDNLTNKFQFKVPENGQYVVPPQGYLLVWADNESGQNATNRADLHVSFALAKGGEAIGLFAADGALVDAVTFGAQITDQSEGRLPDGSGTIAVLAQPSPGSPNSVQSNTAPVLDALANRTVGEGTLLTFTATATDADLPQQTLTFSLEAGAPTGANISSSGVFSWIPTEAQGPGNYPISVRVTDNGVPPQSDTAGFTVQVNEVNAAPALASIANRTVTEGQLLSVTNSVTDTDTPAQSFTFSLESGAPTGMTINAISGVLTWMPTEVQGPGSHPVTVRVTDNGEPPASAIQSFTVTVLEANQAPQLVALSDVSLLAGRTLNLTNTATDADLPAQTLTFQLMSAPAGMTIDPVDGRLTWRPLISQSGTTNPVTVRVVDNGPPSLADTKTFSAIVLKPAAPVLTSPNASNGWFSFGVNGDQGPDYVIERSTALTPGNWLPLFTNLSPLPPFTWSILETNGTRNFYRTRLAP